MRLYAKIFESVGSLGTQVSWSGTIYHTNYPYASRSLHLEQVPVSLFG